MFPTMFTKSLAPTVVLLFSSAPLVHADVVPVSANRQIGVSGAYSCPSCGDPGGSFGMSDSSQTLGLYNQTVNDSFGGSAATVGGSASQTSNVTSNQITLTTTGSYSFEGVINGNLGGSDEHASSLFSLEFALTSPSIVSVSASGSFTAEAADGSGGIFDNSGGLSVVLMGPGVDFSESDSFTLTPPIFQPFSFCPPTGCPFVLQPGLYTLQATNGIDFFSSELAGGFTTSFNMTLEADFTAAPEPSPTVPVLLGVTAAIGWGVRPRLLRSSKRRVSFHRPALDSLR
jgi:hypothetical protein